MQYNELSLFNQFEIIAGPCAIEDYDSLYRTAKFVKSLGVNYLRGGAFKLRTSPNSFQGLGIEAINFLSDICSDLSLFSVSEITDINDIDLFNDKIDVLLVGTRNMYNYPLLKEIGKSKKAVILKRGMSATLEEWLKAAEYISNEGNNSIVLCERGIRTFESHTRNTLDLSAVPAIKTLSNYPIFVDPSHATGNAMYVPSMAKAACASGANGLIIEIHENPENALSDAKQMLSFESFDLLNKQIKKIKSALE